MFEYDSYFYSKIISLSVFLKFIFEFLLFHCICVLLYVIVLYFILFCFVSSYFIIFYCHFYCIKIYFIQTDTFSYQCMYASTITYVQGQSEGHSFHLGQILIISNRDTESTSGFADIPYGSTVMFIYDGQRYFCNYVYVLFYL